MDPLVAAMILQGYRFCRTVNMSWGRWRIFRPDGESMYYNTRWSQGMSFDDLGPRVSNFEDADWRNFPRISDEDRHNLTVFMQQ